MQYVEEHYYPPTLMVRQCHSLGRQGSEACVKSEKRWLKTMQAHQWTLTEKQVVNDGN